VKGASCEPDLVDPAVPSALNPGTIGQVLSDLVVRSGPTLAAYERRGGSGGVGLSWCDDSCLVGEYDCLDAVAEVELHQDPLDVCLDGAAANDELVCDLGV
jgi:hypothetical protein